MSDPEQRDHDIDHERQQPTSLTGAGAEQNAATESTPASAEPDQADLGAETIEQELRGYPDQPTTS